MTGKLLRVKFQVLKGSLRSNNDGRYRTPVFVVLSTLFWMLLYFVSLRVFAEALQVQPVGELLVQKLMGIGLLAIFGLLVFSNVVTVFSTFYLDDELDFLFGKPVPCDSLFIARFIESLAQASWIVLLFGTPIFIAAGVAIGASATYYVALLLGLLPFVTIPTGLAVLFALLATNLLKASRTRDVALVCGIVGFAALFYLIRILRPEHLLNPNNFDSIGEILQLLTLPPMTYLPSDWLLHVLLPLLFDSGSVDIWPVGLLITTALSLFFIGTWVHRPFYFRGYCNVQEGRQGKSLLVSLRDMMMQWASKTGQDMLTELQRLDSRDEQPISTLKQLVHKDRVIFTRDATQWSQLLIVVSIITIYLVNYKYFEMVADEELLGRVSLFFVNLLVCGFAIVALCGRFLFPSVSVEGRSFWLIIQAPISLEKYLVGKWLGAMLPIVIVGQLFIWSSNLLVSHNIVFCIIASLLVLLMTLGAAALAVGMGAMFPQFHNPNAAKIASSFGAVIFMIVAMAMVLIVLVTTFQTSMYLGHAYGGENWGEVGPIHTASTVIGLLLPVVAIWLSIRLGARSLRKRF